jgi:hypothetical protein
MLSGQGAGSADLRSQSLVVLRTIDRLFCMGRSRVLADHPAFS